MTTETESTPPPRSRKDWGIPRPEVIPRPTYFPAAMAFGLTLLLWGVVTSPVVLGVGLVVVVVSLIGWIGEMRHEE
jgi:hypothetical protein